MIEVCFQNTLLLLDVSVCQEPHLLKNIYLDFKLIVKLKECLRFLTKTLCYWRQGGLAVTVPQLKNCGFFVHKHLPC